MDCRNFPDFFVLDLAMLMREHMALVNDLSPWNLRMRIFESRRDMACRLVDGFQFAFDYAAQPPIFSILGKRFVLHRSNNESGVIEHVKQV